MLKTFCILKEKLVTVKVVNGSSLSVQNYDAAK